ncbi:MAG TPA: hypothetical protein VFA44_00705 [Gaiellaceae bacterium]|nr:hypothetical protein [Gaiellaceae bacterium]
MASERHGRSGRAALDAIGCVLDAGGDADDALREVVAILHERGGLDWVGIAFVEGDKLLLGPTAGASAGGERTAVPVVYEGRKVAELLVEPPPDDDAGRALLERVAGLVSAHCLVGWDTRGERWQP